METHEYVRDIFNRALTYYTFHIGLNYLVLGWVATRTGPIPAHRVRFLAIIFILHNVLAMVSYAAVVIWLKSAIAQIADPRGLKPPPYLIATRMMFLTLIQMVFIWIAAPLAL